MNEALDRMDPACCAWGEVVAVPEVVGEGRVELELPWLW
jgi:hypothetical protein